MTKELDAKAGGAPAAAINVLLEGSAQFSNHLKSNWRFGGIDNRWSR